jgi:hypothetical protein
MRDPRRLTGFSVVALLILTLAASCEKAATPSPRQSTAEPLCPMATTSDTPEDEEPAVVEKAVEKPAGNPMGGCGMCHIDIEDELFPSVHFKKKIGCVKCHGRSLAHLADENNEVAPDQMFTKKNTDKLCQTCHDCGRDEVAEQPETHKICTQCHGAHTLSPPAKKVD